MAPALLALLLAAAGRTGEALRRHRVGPNRATKDKAISARSRQSISDAVKDDCFEQFKQVDGSDLCDPLDSCGTTDTPSKCQSLCQNTRGCTVFEWWRDSVLGHEPGLCLLKTCDFAVGCDVKQVDWRGVIGPATCELEDCFDQFKQIEGSDLCDPWDSCGTTDTSSRCQSLCRSTQGCTAFEWWHDAEFGHEPGLCVLKTCDFGTGCFVKDVDWRRVIGPVTCKRCPEHQWWDDGLCENCPDGMDPSPDKSHCVDPTWLGLDESSWIIVLGVIGVIIASLTLLATCGYCSGDQRR